MRDPGLFIEKITLNFFEHLWKDLTSLCGWQFAILFIVGIVILMNRGFEKVKLAYFASSFIFFLVLVTVFYSERFSMYLLPTYLSVAFMFIGWKKLNSAKFTWIVVGLALNLISTPRLYSMLKNDIENQPFDIIYISKQFKSKFGDSENGKIIVARKPNIAYYLGMEFKLFPLVNSYEELIKELKAMNASYLYYSWFEYYFRRNLAHLLNYQSPPPGLEPVAVSENPPAVLYKVK